MEAGEQQCCGPNVRRCCLQSSLCGLNCMPEALARAVSSSMLACKCAAHSESA